MGHEAGDAANCMLGCVSKAAHSWWHLRPAGVCEQQIPEGKAMKIISWMRCLGLAVTALVLPAITSAQQTIKCESNDGHRKYCYDVYQQDRVSMQQQISGSPCELGRSWGGDSRGLWVD